MKSTHPKALRGQPVPDYSDKVSSYVTDAGALRLGISDTVVETRGTFTDYRPGDIWKMLKGTVFQR